MGPTLDEINRRIRHRLSTRSAKRFTAEMLLDMWNEAQDVIVGEAPWAIESTFETVVVARSGKYALPARVIHPTAAIIQLSASNVVRCDYATSDLMDFVKFGGIGRVGTPEVVSYGKLRTSAYAELWPAPSDSYGGKPLWIRARVRARPLVDLTDRTELPARCVQAGMAYVAWQIAQGPDEEPRLVPDKKQEFIDAMTALAESRLMEDADQMPSVAWGPHVSGGGRFD